MLEGMVSFLNNFRAIFGEIATSKRVMRVMDPWKLFGVFMSVFPSVIMPL